MKSRECDKDGWFVKSRIEKIYFGMNESIVFCIMFSSYNYVSWFWLEILSPLLNFFKVTHIYYKINFKYCGLSWIMRHVGVSRVFWFLINMLVGFLRIIILFWSGVGIVHRLSSFYVLDSSLRAWSNGNDLFYSDVMTVYCHVI